MSLTVHHGRYFDFVVQLKIIGSFLSERGNAFEGLVVKPPITMSDKQDNDTIINISFKREITNNSLITRNRLYGNCFGLIGIAGCEVVLPVRP